jgi:hypothetical protein
MSEIQMAHFAFGGESPDRSRIHETAMRDARVATDHHAAEQASPDRTGLVARLGLGSRLRVAFAGGPATTEPCNCPA